MRWKVNAIIETCLAGAESEHEAKQRVQSELWRLVDGLEAALGVPMATSVHILDATPADDDGEG